MASRVALDLLYWAMRSAPYRLIRMAIKMARIAGACFYVVYFMSCITVAKKHNSSHYKQPASYTIVHYYVISKFVYYGNVLTAMDAIVATVVDGGRAIVDIDI